MIEIKHLSHKLGDFNLKNLNFGIQDREYFVILGPSGAGKTVLVECLAGLYKIKQGKIQIDGVDITRLPPEERSIGYVPQDYVLFPFLNVRDNILFGLQRRHINPRESQKRMALLADLLGITHLLERDPKTLSGGEKQRVALARALAPSPQLLLLDEPLSSLDVQTSKYLRMELRRIHQELGVTTVHITHNHLEAEELADRIAIMHGGSIEQIGQPDDIFFAPGSMAVSEFIGSLNILKCDACRQLVPGLMEVDCGGLHLVIPHDEGDMQKIAISPRDVYVSDILPPGSAVNRFKGAVMTIESGSVMSKIRVKVNNTEIKAEMPSELAKEMALQVGKEVYVILKLRRLKVLSGRESTTPDDYKWYYQEII